MVPGLAGGAIFTVFSGSEIVSSLGWGASFFGVLVSGSVAASSSCCSEGEE